MSTTVHSRCRERHEPERQLPGHRFETRHATGAWQIWMAVRENAVRPRPFVGARHGFPFLDLTVSVIPTGPTTDDTEE